MTDIESSHKKMTNTIKVSKDDWNFSDEQVARGKEMAKMIAEHENGMVVKATAHDEIIITSLTPMSELNLSVPVLLYDPEMRPTLGTLFDRDNIITDRGMVKPDVFIGWRRAPKFKPEWME